MGPIESDVLIPTRNDDLWSQNIIPVVISAAESHNVIVSKKGGEVYSFGNGKYGKLGIATRKDLRSERHQVSSANPANVRDHDGEPLELGELPDFAIQQGKLDIRSVSSYSNHSIALSRDGVVEHYHHFDHFLQQMLMLQLLLRQCCMTPNWILQ